VFERSGLDSTFLNKSIQRTRGRGWTALASYIHNKKYVNTQATTEFAAVITTQSINSSTSELDVSTPETIDSKIEEDASPILETATPQVKSRCAAWAVLARIVRSGKIQALSRDSVIPSFSMGEPDSSRALEKGLDTLLGGGVAAMISRVQHAASKTLSIPKTENEEDTYCIKEGSTESRAKTLLPEARRGGITDCGMAAESAKEAERPEQERRGNRRADRLMYSQALVLAPAWLGSSGSLNWPLAGSSPSRIAELQLNPFLGISILQKGVVAAEKEEMFKKELEINPQIQLNRQDAGA
jgi:hypothetical protein